MSEEESVFVWEKLLECGPGDYEEKMKWSNGDVREDRLTGSLVRLEVKSNGSIKKK